MSVMEAHPLLFPDTSAFPQFTEKKPLKSTPSARLSLAPMGISGITLKQTTCPLSCLPGASKPNTVALWRCQRQL